MPRTRRYARPVRGDVALIALADCGPITESATVDRNAWEAAAEIAILAVAATGLPFTTFDVVREHKLTEPPDHHLWGNLMHRLHAAGYIVPIDWTTSHRPTSNSSGVRVWIGTTSTVTAVAA